MEVKQDLPQEQEALLRLVKAGDENAETILKMRSSFSAVIDYGFSPHSFAEFANTVYHLSRAVQMVQNAVQNGHSVDEATAAVKEYLGFEK